MECDKLEVLRTNNLLLCDNIDLENTTILDELYQSNVITSDEIEDIKLQKKKREQTATLLNILKRTDSRLKPYESFIKAIAVPYGFIVSNLQRTLNTQNRNHTRCQICKICTRCAFLTNLNPRPILESLYQWRIISDDDKEDIYNKSTRKLQVEKLLEILSSTINPSHSFNVFLDNLPNKYQYLKQKVNNGNYEELRKCCCEKANGNNDLNCVNRGDNNRDIKLGELVVCTSNIVQKHMPYDKSLVKQLGEIWNNLWHCREQGSWEKLDRMTRDYFEMYSDNPDVLTLLYRSEMGTWAFYRYDYDKACKYFTEAEHLLPFTKMSSWHIGRILAINVGMCVKQGQYSNAHSALVSARQSTALLKPCLATGTVNVFEGLYHSSLLIHGSRGEGSNCIKKRKDRAKECFLRAIKDYQTVNCFAIQSFLSEIYIFLAMLELGIDFRQISGHLIGHKNSLPSENHMSSEIERNLYKFKNECWNFATNWSKMLFHIVTAEHQIALTNLEEAKKSFQAADICGKEGKFQNQQSYITQNIEMLEAKLEAEKIIKHYSFENLEDNIYGMDTPC